MQAKTALVVIACFLFLLASPPSTGAASPSPPPPSTSEVDMPATKDGGATISIIGIIIGTLLSIAGSGGEDVSVGTVSVEIDNVHLHVGDTRDLIVTFSFSNGNINSWDPDYPIRTRIRINGKSVGHDERILSGAVRDTLKLTIPVEGTDFGTASIQVHVEVCGQDHGLLGDKVHCLPKDGVRQAGVLHPAVLSLAPPAGENFDHGVGVMHGLVLENHSSKVVNLLESSVNATTRSFAKAAAGTDYSAPTASQVLNGAVNHTDAHTQQIESVVFQWGTRKYTMFTSTYQWSHDLELTYGTDFCVQEGKRTHPTPLSSPLEEKSKSSSTGCFQPGFVQRTDLPHNFVPSGITVSLTNDLGTAPVYDLVSDANGQVCWSSLELAETIDIVINSDGNKPEIEQTTFLDVPLVYLETSDPALIINYVEALVPPIIGVLEASDGAPLHAAVYSRRPGFADHPIGLVSDGAFALSGLHMLEFNGFSSELVFVPLPPFNRTVLPDTPEIIPFDPTFSGDLDLGTISFPIAARSNAAQITLSGTFLDPDLVPVEGLSIEVYDGPTLLGSDLTDVNGDFEIVVPNGIATVSAPNLAALGFKPLPDEIVDFGANGLSFLNVGNRVIFPIDVDLIFGDGFESGDTSAWSNTVP